MVCCAPAIEARANVAHPPPEGVYDPTRTPVAEIGER
jgi:hypothetical protein